MLPGKAATVNGVLSPSADVVEMRLGLHASETEPVIVVRQDGLFLDPRHAGKDIEFTPQGESIIRVTQPRLYQLVHNPDYMWHELELTFQATGLALYAFTFTTCIAPYLTANDSNTRQTK